MRSKSRVTLATIAMPAVVTVMLGGLMGSAPSAQQTPPAAPARVPPLIMTSTAWEDAGVIPEKFTQAVPNAVSPELKWTQVPPSTQSFVLLMHDPEPVLNKGLKMDITHWLIRNIPGTSTGLPEGVAQGELADGSPAGQPAIERVHGTGRTGRPVPSLHVRAVRARHQARCPARGAAAGGGDQDRRVRCDGRTRPR